MNSLALRSLRSNLLLHQSQSHVFLRAIRLESQISTPLLLHHRQASNNVSSATLETPPCRSKVNGPLSTLPAPLSVPERTPNQSTPSYLLSVGKSYVSFYKSGAKAIYSNFQSSRPIQRILDQKYDGVLAKGVDSGFLDREKFQLLLRSRYDTKRVPVFALVFAICGEFTPLVVIFLTNAVPYTCRIPKQVEGDRRKMEERRGISFRNLTTIVPEKGVVVKDLERMQLLHISWSLGLSSKAWDWLGGRLPGLPTMILRRKVRRRVEYLEMDDKLIERYGGVEEMDVEEVRIALVERGVDILGRTEEQLRASLSAWMQARDVVPVEKLLLTRPPAWPSAAATTSLPLV